MELYDYQREAVEKLVSLQGRGGLFMEMGTGKTRTALEATRRMDAKRILVVVPLAAVGVWKREVKSVLPELPVLDCTKGSIKQRAQKLSDATQRADSFLCVVGYESYWREPLRGAIRGWHPHAVIYDEAHRLKGRMTKQARFAHLLAEEVPYRLGLTGTPTPNGLEDLFSLFKAIKPTLFGTRWADFSLLYLVMGGFQGYQIVGYRNEDRAQELVEANSYRITKAEALDLPEQTDVEIPVELSKKETAAYVDMRQRAIAEVQDARTGEQGTALARIVLTNVMRLQQIASGFVKVEGGQEMELGSSKLDALKDLLRDVMIDRKHAVVFARFTHDVRAITSMICDLGFDTYVLEGAIPPSQRESAVSAFRERGGVLVGQMQVSSLAIDLSCASVAVFYSPDYSLTNYLQARDRLHRIGQHFPVTYYNLVATGTVDRKIYNALAKKENLMRKLLDAGRLPTLFEEPE